jgi:phage portal protein BeeE
VSLFRSRERRQWAPEPVIPPFPGVDMFGSTVPTMTSAMRVSAVWACVRLLADTVSMMPLNLYTMQNGIRVQIEPTPNEQRLLTDAEVQKFALGYFRDALHPTSTLVSDQSITQADARSVLERIMAKKDKREPLILGAGLKFQPIAVSPNESQFLETQKYSVATICRIFGVPPEMVAAEAGNSMTYSNVEQRAIDFLTYSIQPWLTRIETSMATWFAGSKHPRFDTSVLLRTDIETFMKAASMAIAAKIHDPNEIRAMRDYPALTQEQKDLLELVPLTISPTGRPISSPPGADTGINFGEEDSNGN